MAVTQTKALVASLSETSKVFSTIAKGDKASETFILNGAKNILAYAKDYGWNEETREEHKRAAYVGLLSIYAGCTLARARDYLDPANEEPKRRKTGVPASPMILAYGATRQRYSVALARAYELDGAKVLGEPPAKKDRKPKPETADKAAPDVTKGAAPGGIPPVGKLDDMASIAATLTNVATWLAKFGRTNAGTLSGKDAGDAGSAARDTIRGFAEGVARVHSALQGAPVDKAKVKTQAARIKKAAPLALPAPEQAAA